MSCRTGTNGEQPRYLGGTAVLPQELEGKISPKASGARKPYTAICIHHCFVKLNISLLLLWKPNSNGLLIWITERLAEAVNARENPLPLKVILYTTAPASSGEVVSPAKPPLPGIAHFCTAMGCSTALDLVVLRTLSTG